MNKSEFFNRVKARLVESYDPTGPRKLAERLEENFPQWFGKRGKYDAKKLLWSMQRLNMVNTPVNERVIRSAMAEVVYEAQKLTDVELGLTAPEDADYEIEREFSGRTLNRAFMSAWKWGAGNQYSVSFEGEDKSSGNISDWKFSKDGSDQRLVRL